MQASSDVPSVSLRFAGGRGVMPRAKRSALVVRFPTAAPSTLGTSARRVTKATRKNKTNFCILVELFFSVVAMNMRKRLEGEKDRPKKRRDPLLYLSSGWNREFVIPVEYGFVISSPFHPPFFF